MPTGRVLCMRVGVSDPLQMLADWCGVAVPPLLGGGIVLGLFVAGLAGGPLHCAPMCGGFVLGQVADRMARLPAAHLCEWRRVGAAALLPYHLGRLTTYAGLGAGAGLGGALLGRLPFLSGVLLLLAAALFALQALRRLAPGLRLPSAERAPPALRRLIAGAAGRLDRTTRFGAYLLGVVLGFLPCGFLYGALAVAAAASTLATGMLAMLAFGLGTVPTLVGIGLVGGAAGRRWQHAAARAAPALMLVNAALLVMLALRDLTTQV